MLGVELATTAPQSGAWWPAGAVFAVDFVSDRHMRGGRNVTGQDTIAFSRPSPRWAADAGGVWRAFQPGEPARTNRGLQVLPASRNEVPNAGMAGAVVGADAALSGLPTFWGQNRFDGDGIRGEVVASGTLAGLPAIDLRISGSAAVGDAQIYVTSDPGTHLPAQAGDAVLFGMMMQLVSGDLAGMGVRLRLSALTDTGGFVSKQTLSVALSGQPTIFDGAFVLASAGTQRARAGLEMNLPGGQDVVLRLAGPMLAKTAAASFPARILTSGSPVETAADALVLNLPPGPLDLTLRREDGTTAVISGVGGTFALDPAVAGPSPIAMAWAT